MNDTNFLDECKYKNKQNIIELEEENKYNYNIMLHSDTSDEEDIKSINELKYDIIQDSYKNMKNSLLILRKRLINNRGFSEPLTDLEVRNLLNIKSYNSMLKNSSLSPNFFKTSKRPSKFSFDKIFYKIKVNYHKFIVSVANDIYNNINTKPINNSFFRRISGQITHNSTKDFNNNLAQLTLKEFLSKSISSVYSNTKENVNRENIEIIYYDIEKYKPLIDFLEYTYKEFYINFYIKDDCINLIKDNFNIKRKSYICFKESVEKMANEEDKYYINEFIEVAKDRFIQFLEGKRVKHNNDLSNDFVNS